MKKGESGSTIVIVVVVLATLVVFVGGALSYTQTLARQVERSNTMQQAQEIGDGAIEIAFSSWREICRESSGQSLPTASFQSIPLPTQANFPGVPNFTASTAPSQTPTTILSNFRVQAVDPQITTVDGFGDSSLSPTTVPPPGIGQTPGQTSAYYLATADVVLPALGNPVRVNIRRVFQKQVISPWNWAIFYNDTLEIQVGPPMNVTGWVHSNGSLYTASSNLTFDAKSTFSLNWNDAFAPGDPRAPGGSDPETPGTPNYPSNLPPAQLNPQLPFGFDPTDLSAGDNANNTDGYYELVQEPILQAGNYSPDTSQPDPLAGQRYYDQAGIKVLVDANDNVTLIDSNYNVISNTSTGNDLALYNIFTSALTTGNTVQDDRENATVRLVTLDMGAVTTGIQNAQANGTLTNFNGIIYVNDTSADPTGQNPSLKRGVMLKNGATLPNGGVTVASPNPVYIQGDYNTGTSGGVQPASDSSPSDPTNPTVSGYTRQPALVAADAVYILSNSWQNANSFTDLSTRVASNTTVNTAILAGIVPSANNNYSGGAENFPRFMETWSSATLTYYGSMVELYNSHQAVGPWGQANVYDPPTRQWYFDTNFYTNPPKGSLDLANYIKQRWYTQ